MKRTLRDPRDVVIEPVVSEKSYDLIEDFNVYTFVVDRGANKTQIKQAVAKIFDVTVVSVNTMNRKGKVKRTGYVVGKRKNTKRALVKLAVGDSIEFVCGNHGGVVTQTNVAGAPVPNRFGLRVGHEIEAGEEPAGEEDTVIRTQCLRAHHLAPPRRRT